MNKENAMKEIREIRDENSKRHLKMTSEELIAEEKATLEWFHNAIGKTKDIEDSNYSVMPEPSYVSQDTEEYTS